MAQDCYAIFKKTYNQAVADGLAVAVATAAAQSAMDDCLKRQGERPSTIAVSMTTTKSGRVQDAGPKVQRRGQRMPEEN